mgnify:CR=1 FL=1
MASFLLLLLVECVSSWLGFRELQSLLCWYLLQFFSCQIKSSLAEFIFSLFQTKLNLQKNRWGARGATESSVKLSKRKLAALLMKRRMNVVYTENNCIPPYSGERTDSTSFSFKLILCFTSSVFSAVCSSCCCNSLREFCKCFKYGSIPPAWVSQTAELLTATPKKELMDKVQCNSHVNV